MQRYFAARQLLRYGELSRRTREQEADLPLGPPIFSEICVSDDARASRLIPELSMVSSRAFLAMVPFSPLGSTLFNCS